MKQAYLIIAHNEFEVLRRLVSALDDESNDIFIHFDRKVKALPEIKTQRSKLFLVEDRVDVKWGTVSQIRCEYALFLKALKSGEYDRFTLLSGTHFPLRPVGDISGFFEEKGNKNLFPYMAPAEDYQVDMKVRRINVLPCSFIWRAFLKIQKIFGIRINRKTTFYNAGNWASLSAEGVRFLCREKDRILRKYKWSFCGDEFFAPTELMASELANTVELSTELLKFEIGRSNAKTYGMGDYRELVSSGCLFARKFSGEDLEIIEKLGSNESHS